MTILCHILESLHCCGVFESVSACQALQKGPYDKAQTKMEEGTYFSPEQVIPVLSLATSVRVMHVSVQSQAEICSQVCFNAD